MRHVAALALIDSLIGACTRASGPILANPAGTATVDARGDRAAAPQRMRPVILPRDDGPID